MKDNTQLTKVIIIGAGRSGTNMLRDILTSIPKVSTWKCDEINPIWKYGNRHLVHDELEPSMSNRRIADRINREFERIARKEGADIVVEKTCANSLRVPYVFSIVPEAKFIFINRDGRDVVASAMKRWTSNLDLRYTLKKLQYVPKKDLPFYVWRYGINRLLRFFRGKNHLSFWGPVYKGMAKDANLISLAEVCSKQWSTCTLRANLASGIIPNEQKIYLKYEDFVTDPVKELKLTALAVTPLLLSQ